MNTGLEFLQLPQCTWTTVPLRSRPVPCSLEIPTNPFSLAQVRFQNSHPRGCVPVLFFHTSAFFYENKCNFPFHLPKCSKLSVASGCLAVWSVIPSPVLCIHASVSSDHLTVSVAIKVNGTPVVSGSFIIYDCERTGAIHPKTP